MRAARGADSSPSAATEARSGASSWRVLAVVTVIAATVVALYWPTLRSLVAAWEDLSSLTYTHGYLIAAICIWLLIRNRPLLHAELAAWSPRAAATLALSSLLWLVSYRSGIEIAHQMLLPIMLWLAVYAATGRRIAMLCLFAFAYFYFAVPVWDLGNEVLQYLTVHAVRIMLAISGISAYVVDNLVHIQSGTFEIAGGCSGLHFFIVALAIAALFGELQRDSLKVRGLLIGLAAVLAIVSNWIRVFTIIVAGYLTDMQHGLIQKGHYYFGWEVFAVTMLVFFVIARWLPVGASARTHKAGRHSMPAAVLTTGVPVALAAIAIGPVWAALVSAAHAPAVPATLPQQIAGWVAQSDTESDWQPVFAGADATDRVDYRLDQRLVSAYVATYLEQHQGKEVVGYGNAVTGSSAADVVSAQRIRAGIATFNELRTRSANAQEFLIWYRYEVAGRSMTSSLVEQLWYGVASLIETPVSRVIALRASCTRQCDSARTSLQEFATLIDAQPTRRSEGSKTEAER